MLSGGIPRRGKALAVGLLAVSAEIGSASVQVPAVDVVRAIEFDTSAGTCRVDGEEVIRLRPNQRWFEVQGLNVPATASFRITGTRALLLHSIGEVSIEPTVVLSGEPAGAAMGGGGGGAGAMVIWAGGNLAVSSIMGRGGNGEPPDGGGGGGGFLELLSDGLIEVNGDIDLSGGTGSGGAEAGEDGAAILAGQEGIRLSGRVFGFRRLLIRSPHADLPGWESIVRRAEKDGRCALGAVLPVEWASPESPYASYLAELRRSARGTGRGRDATQVPSMSWSFNGRRRSIVECDLLNEFRLESQEELRDCFPVALLMALKHLALLHKKAGGEVVPWPTYEEVRHLTHKSKLARDLNGDGGMVHGDVALWASNTMAERMGLPWRFEAKLASTPEDLADALRWGLPLIVTMTEKILSSGLVAVVNPVIEVVQAPGAILEGGGGLLEKVPLIGFLGSIVKGVGKVLQPADYLLPEQNVYSHYLHAFVLVRVNLEQDAYRFADPWAGIGPLAGEARFVDKSSLDLNQNFLKYQAGGFGSARVTKVWRELAPPGSYLIPVPFVPVHSE